MASIHIEEIQKILFEQGSKNALPNQANGRATF